MGNVNYDSIFKMKHKHTHTLNEQRREQISKKKTASQLKLWNITRKNKEEEEEVKQILKSI